MRVKEWKGRVIFLHEVAEGAARRSWGVHVAALAGVPAPIVRRAAALMAAMEKHGGPLGACASIQALPLFAADVEQDEPAVDKSDDTALCHALVDLNPDAMSPKQALEALYVLKALTPTCTRGPPRYD